ncbi:hypothetical protein B0H13DRAFT_1927548 [Mycena leptocephala]|nr:hypothetical protein B0H13DRAFT_1927548 [Mycena leptocephala]
MTRDTDPPEYEDPQFETLIAGLSNLDLRGGAEIPAPLTPPRSTAPQTPRSMAAFHTQGTPDSSARLLFKSPKKKKNKRLGYVVFYGRQPGVYAQWSGPASAEEQIRRVRGALHQGYDSLAEAHAAYKYARERSWTRALDSRPSSPTTAPDAIPVLPVPALRSDSEILAPNPLRGAPSRNQRWYVVYAGIAPGIYGSFLECALNTSGLSNQAHESVETLAEARERWARAVTQGLVRRLYHSYSSQ